MSERGSLPLILGIVAFIATEVVLLSSPCTTGVRDSLIFGVPFSAAVFLGIYSLTGGDVGGLHPAALWVGIVFMAFIGFIFGSIPHICG